MRRKILLALAVMASAQSMPGAAAELADGAEPAIKHFTEEEIAALPMPDTAFEETPLIAADYDKYFFFHRENTSIDEAFADILECDALGSGSAYYGGGDVNPAAFAQYGVLPSAIGGAVASIMVDAIAGSAERRRIRRINMRNCMGFKGYARYGLEKDLWQKFNFEEGFEREEASSREIALKRQARLASGPAPKQKALPL